MKSWSKVSVVSVLVIFLVLGLAWMVIAATTVDLGTADGFAILAGTGVTIGGAVNTSAITGDIGSYETATITGIENAVLTGTNHAGDATTQSAKTALTDAYIYAEEQITATSVLASETDSFSDTGYILEPGIYKSLSTMGITGTLTLNGSATDVWIFQAGSSLTTAGSSVVSLTGGAQACNVFWQVGSSATLGSSSIFKGNILALTSITLGTTANVSGRVLARNGAVTLDGSNTIAKATCATSGSGSNVATTSGGSATGFINVVKVVINDNGGTKTVTDFPLFVNGNRVISGMTNAYSYNAPGAYTVTETADSGYVGVFSGDCNVNGNIALTPGSNKFCFVTNNDIGAPVVPPIPPLIDLVKVPSPLALPNGPGPVTYIYTLRNIGTVPVTDMTLVGDSCSPIISPSGDTNADTKLDLNETWVYHCTTTLSATHTNTVVATGWANGISAIDIASATVVVGVPIVPPLIHVEKRPSVFTLPVGGGAVTYTYIVSNPGTAPLSNVNISSDKCTGVPIRVLEHPGDLNKNDLLESNEEWLFTCLTNITQTTTNTGTASGDANGLTARDFAIATVVVAVVPGLPNAGLNSIGNDNLYNIAMMAGIFAALTYFYFARRREIV